jgi:hypothetical protein
VPVPAPVLTPPGVDEGVYEGEPDVPGTWLSEVAGTELSRIGGMSPPKPGTE